MNIRIIILIAAGLICSVVGYSPQVIHNTKAKNSNGEDVCLYDYMEISPQKTVNQQGKCRELSCDSEFSVTISKCFEDPYGKCHYDGADNSLPYPDCCGIRTCA
jgi:hypothetical protein